MKIIRGTGGDYEVRFDLIELAVLMAMAGNIALEDAINEIKAAKKELEQR